MITECVETALVELYAEASADRPTGVALAAVGSLARRELGPRSDLDLVLLHDGKHRAGSTRWPTQLWYPLWDAASGWTTRSGRRPSAPTSPAAS